MSVDQGELTISVLYTIDSELMLTITWGRTIMDVYLVSIIWCGAISSIA